MEVVGNVRGGRHFISSRRATMQLFPVSPLKFMVGQSSSSSWTTALVTTEVKHALRCCFELFSSPRSQGLQQWRLVYGVVNACSRLARVFSTPSFLPQAEQHLDGYFCNHINSSAERRIVKKPDGSLRDSISTMYFGVKAVTKHRANVIVCHVSRSMKLSILVG